MTGAILDTLKTIVLRVKIFWLCKFRRSRLKETNKHLLLLAWWFPPELSGGVYRPLSIVRAAVQEGWDVTVVCGPDPERLSEAGQYLNDQLPKSVTVVRVRKSKLKPSYRLCPRIDGGFETALETFIHVIDVLKTKPSIVFASGPPFHNFVSAYYLSKHYDAPYALDYRDEWTDCPFSFVQLGNRDRQWEWVCLREASRVIFTTRSFLTKARTSFPGLVEEKCRVFSNGFEFGDVSIAIGEEAPPDDLFVLSFVGALAEHTPPDLFIEDLARVLHDDPELYARFVLQFIGNRNAAVESRMRSSSIFQIVQLNDQVTKPAAMAAMKRSTALLLLNPTGLSRYIPGKFFDYMASGTPILVYGVGGEVADIVEKTKAGIVVPVSAPGQLMAAFDKIKSDKNKYSGVARSSWAREHDRNKIAKLMLEDLSELVA